MNGWTKFALGINMAGVAFNAAVGVWPWMVMHLACIVFLLATAPGD